MPKKIYAEKWTDMKYAGSSSRSKQGLVTPSFKAVRFRIS
jgi:hypothetical protein